MSFNKQAAKTAAKQIGAIVLIVLSVAVVIAFLMAVLLLVNYHPVIGLPLLVVAVLGGLGFFFYREAVQEQELDERLAADEALFEERKLQRQRESADSYAVQYMGEDQDKLDLYRNHRYDRKTGQEY